MEAIQEFLPVIGLGWKESKKLLGSNIWCIRFGLDSGSLVCNQRCIRATREGYEH
ncbi:hypothetical protein M8C21_016443 [Ambrosia artemisiifolia]|uniref:Uncharacterized protein n=1 Tax=Ambrosia artemisiifolia TaxID=4212 RepID=A0AAD5G5B8_AMBAR|nr:hypothetical protein M8C21_016443 [Ambrosia artemisiifolia]